MNNNRAEPQTTFNAKLRLYNEIVRKSNSVHAEMVRLMMLSEEALDCFTDIRTSEIRDMDLQDLQRRSDKIDKVLAKVPKPQSGE